MKNTCQPANLAVSALMHIFILFTVLSILFIFIVSKLEKATFDGAIQKVINEGILPQLESAGDERVKSVLRTLPYEKLEVFYSKQSDKVTITNKWLTIIMVIVSGFLFSLIMSLIIAKRDCINIGEIILENVIVFSLVGVFEFVFFKTVASKYEPIQPSTFQRTVYDKLWA